MHFFTIKIIIPADQKADCIKIKRLKKRQSFLKCYKMSENNKYDF